MPDNDELDVKDAEPGLIEGLPSPPGEPFPSLLEVPASTWRYRFRDGGLPGYRGDQVARWVFRHGVFDFAGMTDLPAALRSSLAATYTAEPARVDRAFTSVDGTCRSLLVLADGEIVEAVRMPYRERVTQCISSQVGCRFGCGFCQTGRMGLRRNLTAGEIVGQVARLRAEHDDLERKFNVVFMGQGEPLDNLDAVIGAIVSLQDPAGPDLSWRRITVSTVGILPGLRRLAGLGARRPRLAISLSAASDELRSRLMPVNRKYPIAELVGALKEISWRRGERVTFEYVLLAGVNDGADDARALARVLEPLPAKVNLIPWNPLPEMSYRRPGPAAVDSFRRQALRLGLDVLVRYSRGADIGAACGQLHADAGGIARNGLIG